MMIEETGLYKFTKSWKKKEGNGYIPKGITFLVIKIYKNGAVVSPSFTYNLTWDMPVEKIGKYTPNNLHPIIDS